MLKKFSVFHLLLSLLPTWRSIYVCSQGGATQTHEICENIDTMGGYVLFVAAAVWGAKDGLAWH